MHLNPFITLASILALPFLSAQPTKDGNGNGHGKGKPCVVPAVSFTSFDYVFNLTAITDSRKEHIADGKSLRLLRTPNSAEVTPFLDVGDLVDFGFREGRLSIVGGRLAYDLPTIAIFPPVLVPWKMDLNVEPRLFTASYTCDRKGNQILVLKPDGAEGFAVERTDDGKNQVFIKPFGYVGDAIDFQLIVGRTCC
ncbi:hypothetical protein MMC16_001093 [Acarospora aff. strigata]|nr:hypothetical protein [Acarospora aff. strigata]